jgi:hypothetical protein
MPPPGVPETPASVIKLLVATLLGYAAARSLAQKPNDPPASFPPGTEEAGATGPELRYWLAKEAVRQGEVLLKFQATTIAAIQKQATTLLGWVVTATTAAVTVAISTDKPEWRSATILIAAGLTITAVVCIVILLPREIRSEAFEPNQLLGSVLKSELENLESLAEGHSTGISINKAKLIFSKRMLITAWILFVLSPLSGAALETYVTFPAWAPAHQPAAAKDVSK